MDPNPALEAALDRLQNFYDGERPYNPTTNPGGFRNGGNVPNFVPALQDTALVIRAAAVLLNQAIQTGGDVEGAAQDLNSTITAALAAYGSADALTAAVKAAQDAAKQAGDILGAKADYDLGEF